VQERMTSITLSKESAMLQGEDHQQELAAMSVINRNQRNPRDAHVGLHHPG
jgi:hypothetical protein